MCFCQVGFHRGGNQVLFESLAGKTVPIIGPPQIMMDPALIRAFPGRILQQDNIILPYGIPYESTSRQNDNNKR